MFWRLSKAFKQVWTKGRTGCEDTLRVWTEGTQFDRWKEIRLGYRLSRLMKTHGLKLSVSQARLAKRLFYASLALFNVKLG